VGTLLAMNGSDGISLDGLYHEEHALPSFVHARSKDQLRHADVAEKMETPVIYFYTPQVQRVEIEVGYPTGLWTSVPAGVDGQPGSVAGRFRHRRRATAISAGTVSQAPSMKTQRAAATDSDALWNYARDVRRGVRDDARPDGRRRLGAVHLLSRSRRGDPCRCRCVSAADSAQHRPTEADGVRHLFILRVENGRGAYAMRLR
jgi:hypothetical protein